MADIDIRSLITERGVLVADGGMGTSLFGMGLSSGDCPELWNVEYPEKVADVHSGFIAAGSDIVLTNTFGGTRSRLELHGYEDRVAEFSAAGVEVARKAAASADRPVVVAGSVGPTGSLFEPLGPLTIAAGTEIFAEQTEALADAGADVIWIETLSAVDELAAAVVAARRTGLPIVTTMSFDTHGKTMMGVDPADLASWWLAAADDPVAIGANCGVGPADAVLAAAEIHQTHPEAVVIAKANCGVPEYIDGILWYPASGDDMTGYARLARDAGARIIGACCGSVPDHIRQIRAVVDSYEPGPIPDIATVEAELGPVNRPKVPAAGRGSRRRRRAASD